MDKRLLMGAVAVAVAAPLNAAQAAKCAQRDDLVSRLESKYSEKLSARGLQSEKSMIEVFASVTSGTFTVLLTNPQGVSCVVGAGTNWHIEEPAEVKGIAG